MLEVCFVIALLSIRLLLHNTYICRHAFSVILTDPSGVKKMSVIDSEPEKVIYQYRLLAKMRTFALLSYLFSLGLIVSGVSFHIVLQNAAVWFWLPAGCLCWVFISYIVTKLVIARRRGAVPEMSRYRLLFRTPWFGYVPVMSVSFAEFRFVQWHLFVIGLILSLGIAVWVPAPVGLTLIFVHLWCSLPRLFVLLSMQRAAQANSIILLAKNEVSLYAP